MLKSLDPLTMLPPNALDVLESVRTPDCSLAELTGIIQRDVRLASSILVMANSAANSLRIRVSSLDQALLRLGPERCRNLILSTSIASLLNQLPVRHKTLHDQLSKHAYVTGFVAAGLNREMRIGFQGEEFAAGIIHDLGRFLFAVLDADEYWAQELTDESDDGDILEREAAIFDADHCQLGCWYASRSGLPDDLLDVIRHHHRPERAEHDARLVSLTAAAEHVANFLTEHDDWNAYEPATNPAIQTLERAGVADAKEKFTDRVGVVMKAAVTGIDDYLAFARTV